MLVEVGNEVFPGLRSGEIHAKNSRVLAGRDGLRVRARDIYVASGEACNYLGRPMRQAAGG